MASQSHTNSLKIPPSTRVFALFDDVAAASQLGVCRCASDLEYLGSYFKAYRGVLLDYGKMRWICFSLKHLPLPAEPRPKAPQRMSRICLVNSCSGRSRMPTNYIMIASPPYRLIRRDVLLPFARILRGEEQIR